MPSPVFRLDLTPFRKDHDMDTNLLVGAFALLFGLATLVGRFVAPDSAMFSKLGPMKERFGEGPGTALHVVAYTVLPLAVGVSLLALSYAGGP